MSSDSAGHDDDDDDDDDDDGDDDSSNSPTVVLGHDVSDTFFGGDTDTGGGGDDLERLAAANVPPVNILLRGPPLARSLTFDIGVRFKGGDGGNVSPQSLLSRLPPHSDAVLYSSSDENIADLDADSAPSKLKYARAKYYQKVITAGHIQCTTYEGLTVALSSVVSPAALRMADTQLVRIPEVIADKTTRLSSQDCGKTNRSRADAHTYTHTHTISD